MAEGQQPSRRMRVWGAGMFPRTALHRANAGLAGDHGSSSYTNFTDDGQADLVNVSPSVRLPLVVGVNK